MNPKHYPAVQRTQTLDKGHGRLERCSDYLSGEIDWYADREKWTGLAGLEMVHFRVEINGQITENFRYFIGGLVSV